MAVALLALAGAAVAGRPPIVETKIDAGLAVHVGAPGDGAVERALAASGRRLVLSLTLDEPAASAEAGLAGIVTVARWRRPPRLPLADHMANLVVVDADALGTKTPSDDELRRVLVPARGKALVRRDGKWTTLEKPMPKAFGEWTHFFHGADGNALSRDTAVRVPNALRWIGGPRQHDSQGANAWRVAGGVAVSEWNSPLRVKNVQDAVYVEARDAFNGALLWQRAVRGGSQAIKTKPLILAAGRLLRIDDASEDWKLAAYDPRTGKLLRRYDHSFSARSAERGYPRTGPLGMVYADGAIYQTMRRGLRCLDAESGELRWEYTTAEGEGDLFRPTLAADLGLVIALEGPGEEEVKRRKWHWKGLYGGRYPSPVAEHLVAIDIRSGKRQWRVQRDPSFYDLPSTKLDHEVNRRKIVFHVVAYSRGRVFLLFACDANGGGPSLVLCHDARTGRKLWHSLTRPKPDPTAGRVKGGGEMFNLFALDDGTLFAIGHRWARLDQRTGKLLGYGNLGGNARCDTHSCTVGLVTAGFGNFFDLSSPELRWTRRDLARGQCGGRSTPAYGMTYHQSSGCKCFLPIRGQMALHRAREPEPLAADARLVRGPKAGKPLGPPTGDGDWPTYLGNLERSAWARAEGPKSLDERWRAKVAEPLAPDTDGLRRDWLQTSLYNGPATAPVVAGGILFVADRDRHRLVALDAATGKPRWTAPTGARVTTPPTVANGRVVFGTRNGWVHCLDAETGELVWRFLAAPEPRFIVAYGQTESAWPLHGCLPVVAGTIVATAGYHGEADGGVWAWGLDLATGAVRWQRRLHRPERPWVAYGPPDRHGTRNVRDVPQDLGYVNRSNGGYCVTDVRNVDVPACGGGIVRAARILLDPATGVVAATPRALTGERDKRPSVPPFIAYTERFPHLDMEFEAPGGPHGSGSWTWGSVGDYRSGIRRLAHNGKAVVLARLAHPAPELHYLASPDAWNRDDFRNAKPIATLKGRTDSLAVAGHAAYVAGEGMGTMPWGRNETRPRHRIAKGEPIPGHLMAVSLPDGRVLADTEIDSAAVNNGLAVAAGRLYAVCEDGTVRCYGPDGP